MLHRCEKDLTEWGLGGLTGQDGCGLYRPPWRSAVIIPSSVELKNEGLQWRIAYPIKCKPTGKGLLEDFVKLDGAPDEAVRDYARNWGVLEICKHGYPRSHNQSTWPRSWSHLSPPWALDVLETFCEPLGFKFGIIEKGKKACTRDSSPLIIMQSDGKGGAVPITRRHRKARNGSTENTDSPQAGHHVGGQHYEEGREPIERWRYFARQARAILNIAAKLNLQSTCVSEEWALLYREYKEDFDWLPKRLSSQNLEDARRLLSFAVNDWLQLGGVRPQFVWKESAAKLEVGGATLFGHLAMQLALVASGTKAMVFCSHCGSDCSPSKQPNPNRRHFCDRCRDEKIPERLASRDYRARLNRSNKTGVQNPSLKRP